MGKRDDFSRDDSSRDRPRPGGPAGRPGGSDGSDFDDEQNEFARRLQGAKRETVKREREQQKFARQEMESELNQQSHNRDRRALEKDLKRKHNELKRVADTLSIKQTLQRLSGAVSVVCWGPDVASDKARPSIGVFLNYTPVPLANSIPAEHTHSLFGVWLYMAGSSDQIQIVIGSKHLADDAEQSERATVPGRDSWLFATPYKSGSHADIQSRIEQALLAWQPA